MIMIISYLVMISKTPVCRYEGDCYALGRAMKRKHGVNVVSISDFGISDANALTSFAKQWWVLFVLNWFVYIWPSLGVSPGFYSPQVLSCSFFRCQATNLEKDLINFIEFEVSEQTGQKL